MINFVVCDLEYTLIPEGGTSVSEEIIDLISELKNNDVRFAVATGRNYDAVRNIFGKVKNDIIYICNDGGVVIYQDKVLSKTPIDRRVCFEVETELGKDSNFKTVFAGERKALVNTHDTDFINYLKRMGIELENVKDVKSIHEDVTKITIYSRRGLDEETYEHFFNKWSKHANVAISSPEQAYITGEYVTKGNALALVQHIFNISEEDTVVLGGGYSDIDMFGHSYFSYAMQNSDNEVKRAAKHIAENVETILEDILRM